MATTNTRRGARLTTTSYAILGLLALREWTTYELAQQMRRGFRLFWPRAESAVYAEPKKLARLGLARARVEWVGRRRRTVYSITPKGRQALRRWTREPSRPVSMLESEILVKLFFNEHATKDALLAHIDALHDWANEVNIGSVGLAREYVRTGGPFPERLAQLELMGRLFAGFADFLAEYAANARRVVERWPADPSQAEPDWEYVRAVASRPLPDDYPPELIENGRPAAAGH